MNRWVSDFGARRAAKAVAAANKGGGPDVATVEFFASIISQIHRRVFFLKSSRYTWTTWTGACAGKMKKIVNRIITTFIHFSLGS